MAERNENTYDLRRFLLRTLPLEQQQKLKKKGELKNCHIRVRAQGNMRVIASLFFD